MTRPTIRPGERAPDFSLPTIMQPGEASLADYRAKGPVLLGLFRGLHCPFCRRQIFQLSAVHDSLAAMGITALAVVNTPRERAQLYFRYHPARVELLADPDARTHALFGVPTVAIDDVFHAARINPTGELPEPMHPMEANTALNAREGFVMTAVDEQIVATHGAQLTGHFLIDREGIVRWSSLEAEGGVADLARLPSVDNILAAARSVGL